MNEECIVKFEKITQLQPELENGNIEVAKKVRKEIELLSYLSCYSDFNNEQKKRIELLDRKAKVIISEREKTNIRKNYSEVGGLKWDNFNSSEIKDKDGQELSFATDITKWKELSDKDEPAYCYFNFDMNNSNMGLVYNHAAVRVLSHSGKRVPSMNDFETLLDSLKVLKNSSTLCSIIFPSSCSFCKCLEFDYDRQIDFNYKPYGWLSVTKSGKEKWKENGEDMYYWTLDKEKSQSTLSGLGLAQFKQMASIRTVILSEINNSGNKPSKIKKEDFEYNEKYFGTFIRFVRE